MNAIDAVGIGVQIYELARREGWLDRLFFFLQKTHRVLVFGHTGVGKSNLIDSLVEDIPQAIDYLQRTQYVQKTRVRIRRKPFVFIDTPGELDRARVRGQVLREAITKRPIAGILNVVSYGYHENRTGLKQAIRDDGSVNEEYLAARRKDEREILNEWLTVLGDPDYLPWVITVVTKADIWWNQREEVLEYYQRGEYGQDLHDRGGFGQTTVLPYSSVLHKFYGRVPLPGTFDDQDRRSLRSQLLLTLVQSVSRSP